LWGTWYFCASRDKKTEKPTDETFNYAAAHRKTVIFIRHGESEWNQVFNKGPIISRPFKLIVGIIREAFMVFDKDSIFLDSPLSPVGMQQAWDLLTFLASQPEGCQEGRSPKQPVSELDIPDIVSIIRGDVGESFVVSSILRRAISTGVLGLSTRLLKTKPSDRIQLMTSLQEISRNVDTLSLTGLSNGAKLPQVPAKEAAMKQMGDIMSFFYRKRLSGMHNKGNKTLRMKAIDRQREFTAWLFNQQKQDAIIVCGHSLYFREFFRSYMPKASTHEAKSSKMANCSCVAFDFYKLEATGAEKVRYKNDANLRIRPESIKTIYLGFEGKKSKKAKVA
jgi:broad specificity phosphatase PhoE